MKLIAFLRRIIHLISDLWRTIRHHKYDANKYACEKCIHYTDHVDFEQHCRKCTAHYGISHNNVKPSEWEEEDKHGQEQQQ